MPQGLTKTENDVVYSKNAEFKEAHLERVKQWKEEEIKIEQENIAAVAALTENLNVIHFCIEIM